jgi:hypothetical protein
LLVGAHALSLCASSADPPECGHQPLQCFVHVGSSLCRRGFSQSRAKWRQSAHLPAGCAP